MFKPVGIKPPFEVITHQATDFKSYYLDNKTLLFNNYICGINIKIFGNQDMCMNENKIKVLQPIIYAINKIHKRVDNLSKIVRGVNVYVEEANGLLQVQWPERQDKKMYNDLKSYGVYIENPCLHINCKTMTQLHEKKSQSWLSRITNKCLGSNDVDKFGPWGVADQLYDAALSRKRKLSEPNPILSIKAIASIVHEIGHIIHEQRKESKEIFWEGKMLALKCNHIIPSKIAKQVSKYVESNNNSTEFVAEVFTGLIYEKKYSKEVLEYYKYYCGPELIDMKLPELPPGWSPST
ncbi:hypothetical protein [Xenorhabdus hominickii]|uniref:Uncharacterized protein n=1 Tax=Xenorhabdus hominickii TaxID=351679 RepID=A0A2G0QF94_XENHO|nr:hypothetical protein [Xenorhabdus hominickii]AOM41895.1 hypothetical protein A9255_15825 [Xenorhabdus hominickii]PHM57871.1 hypothetical protein Xhom_00874 [Xenorhabdus hominickii]